MWLNWRSTQKLIKELELSKIALIIMFMLDFLSWPLTLITTSKIILEKENV